MSEINPYAAPQVNSGLLRPSGETLDKGTNVSVWRSGDLLVMRRDACLPDICVKTNAPADYRPTCHLSWHSPALYLAFLFPPALLVAPFFIYRARIALPVSAPVYRRMGPGRWQAVGLLFVGLLFCVACGELGGPVWIPLGTTLLLVACINYVQFASRLVSAEKMDAQYVWIRGACLEYLARWPDLATRSE